MSDQISNDEPHAGVGHTPFIADAECQRRVERKEFMVPLSPNVELVMHGIRVARVICQSNERGRCTLTPDTLCYMEEPLASTTWGDDGQ